MKKIPIWENIIDISNILCMSTHLKPIMLPESAVLLPSLIPILAVLSSRLSVLRTAVTFAAVLAFARASVALSVTRAFATVFAVLGASITLTATSAVLGASVTPSAVATASPTTSRPFTSVLKQSTLGRDEIMWFLPKGAHYFCINHFNKSFKSYFIE